MACAFESGHFRVTLLSGAGEGEVVSQRGGWRGGEGRARRSGQEERQRHIHRYLVYVTVEIDPHRRLLGRSQTAQTDFALQAFVECRAAKAK